jgi:hypothetical protein
MVDETNTKSDLKRHLKPAEVFVLVIVGIGGIWLAAQLTDGNSNAAPTAPPIQPAAPRASAVPSHNYAYVGDDGRYGYTQVVSTNDSQSGLAQKPLVMVRYLGQKNGVYSVAIDQEGTSVVASCSAPCEYMTLTTYAYGSKVDKSVMPTTGTIGGEMLADAMAGSLKVFVARRGHTGGP